MIYSRIRIISVDYHATNYCSLFRPLLLLSRHMSNSWTIKGGRIMDPSTGRNEISDLYIDNGRISDKPSPSAQTYDATGMIVAPGFIATVRKKLALDQREAAEIFGGGINAFSRYENGKTKPPLSLVKLLKVLDRHPDLLNEVRTA